jgi:hypothetical protein
VIRVPTEAGSTYFKAAVPSVAHDAAVTEVLAGLRPDLVLTPLGIDPERGWLLLPEGGERLREVIEDDGHPGRYEDVVRAYAGLQMDAAPRVDDLVALGLPDYRLSRLPALAEEHDVDASIVGELCEQLAALRIPETVQHDDLHSGNVFVRDGAYVFFDWGDSCASHPFLSLTVCLRAVTWGFELAERDPEVERIRDAYLERWAGCGTGTELRRAAEVAVRLGKLSRALTWWRIAPDLGGGAGGEEDAAARSWRDEFLAG